MEILEFHVIETAAWWFYALLLGGTILGITGFAIFDDSGIAAAISWILAVACFITVIAVPSSVPTDKMSYTIEITDSTKYQELVEKGYTFSRVYENREIYIIEGDELKCE